MRFCATCGKRINRGRAGSLTQWILRGDSCNCDSPLPATPHPGRSAASDAAAFDFAEALVTEAELDVSADTFPRERYKAVQLIGSGASGRVYRCLDRVLNLQVAVKILLSVDDDHVISFQKEAKTGSSLSHPGLVAVRDFGVTTGGAPYMVMDYVPGLGLDSYLEQEGPLTESEATEIFLQLTGALAYAHGKGIFHRDLKTSNILIYSQNDELRASIIDFGVSNFMQEKTMVGNTMMVGTPNYMAPDQAQGRPFDARSEVYSLGCVLFEALTGNVPLQGDTALATVNLHASAPVPSLEEKAGFGLRFSKSMQSIVSKCLAKNPRDRFQSMDELNAALLQVQNFVPAVAPLFEMPDSAVAQREPSETKGSVFGSAKAVLALILVGVFGLVVAGMNAESIVTVFASRSKVEKPMSGIEQEGQLADTVRVGLGKDFNNSEPAINYPKPGIIQIEYGRDADLKTVLQHSPHTLTLTGGDYSPETLESLSQAPIKSFTANGIDFSMVKKISMKQNKKLDLGSCRLPQGRALSIFSDSPLEQLTLTHCKLDNSSLDELRNFKQLDEFHLHLCSGVTGGLENARTVENLTWTPEDLDTYPQEAFEKLFTLKRRTGLALAADKMTDQQFDILTRDPLVESISLTGGKLIGKSNFEKLTNFPQREFRLHFNGRVLDVALLPLLRHRKHWSVLGFFNTGLNDADMSSLTLVNAASFVFDEHDLTAQGMGILMSNRKCLVVLGSKCTDEIAVEQLVALKHHNPGCTIRTTAHGLISELTDNGQLKIVPPPKRIHRPQI